MFNRFKKITVSILLAVATAILLLCGGGVFSRLNKSSVAEAATVTTTAQITVDKTAVVAGEEFTVTLKLNSAMTDATWSSVDFFLGEVDPETGKGVATNAANLEFVEGSYIHNFDSNNYSDYSIYNATADKPSRVGMHIALAYTGAEAKASTEEVVVSFKLKVKESAGSIGKLVFGIGKVNRNFLVLYPSNGGASVRESFATIPANTAELNVGAANSNNI